MQYDTSPRQSRHSGHDPKRRRRNRPWLAQTLQPSETRDAAAGTPRRTLGTHSAGALVGGLPSLMVGLQPLHATSRLGEQRCDAWVLRTIVERRLEGCPWVDSPLSPSPIAAAKTGKLSWGSSQATCTQITSLIQYPSITAWPAACRLSSPRRPPPRWPESWGESGAPGLALPLAPPRPMCKCRVLWVHWVKARGLARSLELLAHVR
jgi:hypothetical protein